LQTTSYSERHPYWFSILIAGMVVTVYLVFGSLATIAGLGEEPANVLIHLGSSITLCVLAILIIWRKGWWRRIGFGLPARPADLLWFILPLVLVAVNIVAGINPAALANLLYFFVLALLAGFVEEAIFRGIILQALAPRGVWRAALVTAAIFGVSHALNVLTGSVQAYVLLQICYAFAIGFAFAALVLRTRLIWPLMLVHFLTDLFGFLASNSTGGNEATPFLVVVTAIYVVLFTTYGIYLLVSWKRVAVGKETRPLF
jgi:membrane protease YdiL (CAAX protease family)